MLGPATRVVASMLPLVLLGLHWVSLGHGAGADIGDNCTDPTVSCRKCPQTNTTTPCPGWLTVEGTEDQKYDGLFCKTDQLAHDSPVYDGPGIYAMSK